jgi:hypothetical protein
MFAASQAPRKLFAGHGHCPGIGHHSGHASHGTTDGAGCSQHRRKKRLRHARFQGISLCGCIRVDSGGRIAPGAAFLAIGAAGKSICNRDKFSRKSHLHTEHGCTWLLVVNG